MSIDLSKLEPAAVCSDADGRNLALFSIAMSLKRIADAMEEKKEYGGGGSGMPCEVDDHPSRR